MPKVLGSYRDGSDIYKDKAGLYVIRWNATKQKEEKKHLKTLKRFLAKPEKTRRAKKKL